MAHNHQHTISSAQVINRSFILGIVLNVVYVIIELIYGFTENSTSLLSDAVHNIGDISGLLLAFLAFKLLKVKASKIFTYGLKKGSIVTAFINSVLLAFAIGAIAWEGVHKIINPSPLSGITIIWVALIGVVINFVSALLFRKNQHQDLNVKAAYWHLMSDAIVSVGVVISGIVIHYTHWYMVDGIAAIIIAVVVLFSTWRLFKDSAIAILDGVPTSVNTDEIKSHLISVKGVLNVHHIHVWGISTNENAMTAHVQIDKLENMPMIKKNLKSELDEHNIKHSTLEFEIVNEDCQETSL